MRKTQSPGGTNPHESDKDQATVITSGIMVDEVLKAYEALQAEGITVRVIDMFTWKPLDEGLVLKAAKETRAIVTVENHNTTCGLGSVAANCPAKNAAALILQGISARYDCCPAPIASDTFNRPAEVFVCNLTLLKV